MRSTNVNKHLAKARERIRERAVARALHRGATNESVGDYAGVSAGRRFVDRTQTLKAQPRTSASTVTALGSPTPSRAPFSDDDQADTRNRGGHTGRAPSAAGVWLAGAGTALAPEPVHLRDPLGTTQGTTANAFYVNSGSSASVLNWPGSYTPGSAPTGTPCWTNGLPAGYDTSKVIVAYGSYPKCQ